MKETFVRSRYLQLKDMDAPNSFFFSLERSVAQGKQMTCPRLPGGKVTIDPSEMRNHATDFYTDLFGAERCSMEELLQGLLQLSPEEKAALDWELALGELTVAVHQLVSERAPGIDGLSSDFY